MLVVKAEGSYDLLLDSLLDTPGPCTCSVVQIGLWALINLAVARMPSLKQKMLLFELVPNSIAAL